MLHAHGLLHFAWVVPYGLATLALGAAYVEFLRRLPRKTAVRFVVAGAIFVSGAVGCEMIGGWIEETRGRDDWMFRTEVVCEETLEMAGIALFIRAMLDRLHDEGAKPAVKVPGWAAVLPPAGAVAALGSHVLTRWAAESRGWPERLYPIRMFDLTGRENLQASFIAVLLLVAGAARGTARDLAVFGAFSTLVMLGPAPGSFGRGLFLLAAAAALCSAALFRASRRA